MSRVPAGGSDHTLKRELNLLDALMINVGTTLASAIFIVPAIVVTHTGSPWLAGVVWLLAGVFSWAGAVTFAELAVLYPRAGGEFVYLEEIYSRFWGFLYGWTLFSVIQTASIAAAAVALMTYVAYFLPLGDFGIKVGAIAFIVGLSAWNCISLRTSANTQNSTTLAKLAMAAIIVVVCFVYGGEGAGALREMMPSEGSRGTLAGLSLAMVAALWAFDGWVSVTFVAGEVREPGRILPRALSYSALALIAIYLLINGAFMNALPLADMAVSERVAADAVERAVGSIGGGLVSLAVIISCFAAINGFIFTGARVYYAMAEEGVFFPWAARLSENGTPVNAILAQMVWASAIALTGTYDQLFTYVVFDSWLFYLLGAVGVILLRWREPEKPRPYRTVGYPYVPLLFGLFAAGLLVQTLVEDPRDSLIGIAIMLLGVPGYFYWTRSTRSAVE